MPCKLFGLFMDCARIRPFRLSPMPVNILNLPGLNVLDFKETRNNWTLYSVFT